MFIGYSCKQEVHVRGRPDPKSEDIQHGNRRGVRGGGHAGT